MHNAEDNDQRDDFRVEITDLPPEETPGISSVLLDLGLHFFSRVRSLNVKVSWQARDEDEDEDNDDDSFFDLRVTDLPPEEITSISGKLLDSGKRFWPLRRHISTFTLLGSVLLVLVLVFTNIAPFYKKASPPIPSSLVPTREIWDTQGRDATAKILISGNSTIVIEGVATGWTSRADGTVTWQARPTPQDCPPGPVVGNSRQGCQCFLPRRWLLHTHCRVVQWIVADSVLGRRITKACQ